jgi:hypothetical protein
MGSEFVEITGFTASETRPIVGSLNEDVNGMCVLVVVVVVVVVNRRQ